MGAFRSPPRPVGWKALLVAGVAVWALPVLAGVLLLALALVLGQMAGLNNTGAAVHPLLVLHVLGWVFLFSPMLSWIGLLPALPVAGWLIRRGRGGWLSFALLGLAAGTLGGALVPGFATALAAIWGVAAALMFWRLLQWLSVETGP